jgi:hypothetical protein
MDPLTTLFLIGNGLLTQNHVLEALQSHMGGPVHTIHIGADFTALDDRAIFATTTVQTIVFPPDSKVTTIGHGGLANNAGLTCVTFPPKLTGFSQSLLNNCTQLTDVIIPGTVTNIGPYALYNCQALTALVVPQSVTTIGTGFVGHCTTLCDLRFDPDSTLTTIGTSAFMACTSLEDLVLPSSLVTLGPNPFHGVTSMKSLKINPNLWDEELRDCAQTVSFHGPPDVIRSKF